MDRKNFGRLITALRKEHIGLEGNPMTQKELADMCELSDAQIGHLERGDAKVIEPSTLIKLAGVLQLTSGEREVFFASASGIEPSHISVDESNPKVALSKMYRFLESLQLPAFIGDSYGDVVALNFGMFLIYDIDASVFQSKDNNWVDTFNIMRLVFAPEFEQQRQNMRDDWSQFAYNSMMIFRILTFKHRAEKNFVKLLKSLYRYPKFKLIWNLVTHREQDHLIDNHPMKFIHSYLGPLNCIPYLMCDFF